MKKYKKVIIAFNYSEMMYNNCTNAAEFNAISSRDKLFQMDITYITYITFFLKDKKLVISLQ